MKYIPTKVLIQMLEERGYVVSSYKRKDGGYFITNINGVHYAASKGNAQARKILDAPLTTAMKTQRKTTTKIREAKYDVLTPKIKSLIRDARSAWRKAGLINKDPKETHFTRAFYKNILEDYADRKQGIKEVKRKLITSIRYAEGYITSNTVYWFEVRLAAVESKIEDGAGFFDPIRRLLRRYFNKLPDDAYRFALKEILYKIENGTMTPEEGRQAMKEAIKNYAYADV